MNHKSDNFVVESTPVLDLRKTGLENHSEPGIGPAQSWDADRTEVYADIEDSDAIASLVADSGESYPITTFPFVIGRGTECDLVLQGKGISRKHAEIVFQSGRFVVNDIESLNGIKVNGYKVARVILEENDAIKLGEVSLTFHSGDAGRGGEESDQADQKKGLFAKRESIGNTQDDTFGPSPAKKIVSSMVIVLAIGVFAYTGFLYLQKSGTGSSGLDTPAAPRVATTPAQAPAAPVAQQPQPRAVAPAIATPPQAVDPAPSFAGSQAPAADITPPQPSSIAPPPSLSMAPRAADQSTSATVPSAPKTVPPKPAPKKALPNLNSQAAAAKNTAINLYAQGKAPEALAELKQYIGNAAVSKSYQNSVKQTFSEIDGLYSQYTDAQKAYATGDKDRAFSTWTDFMSKESALLSGQKSAYSRSIVTKVMDEYVDRGNQASSQGDYHAAYTYWTKAVELGDSVSAKIAIDNLNNKAQQLYRQALRLEYVNTNKAKAMWAEVTKLLPPGTEYNTKASAKLAWYEKWGS